MLVWLSGDSTRLVSGLPTGHVGSSPTISSINRLPREAFFFRKKILTGRDVSVIS